MDYISKLHEFVGKMGESWSIEIGHITDMQFNGKSGKSITSINISNPQGYPFLIESGENVQSCAKRLYERLQYAMSSFL